jgi:hypothetical protein
MGYVYGKPRRARRTLGLMPVFDREDFPRGRYVSTPVFHLPNPSLAIPRPAAAPAAPPTTPGCGRIVLPSGQVIMAMCTRPAGIPDILPPVSHPVVTPPAPVTPQPPSGVSTVQSGMNTTATAPPPDPGGCVVYSNGARVCNAAAEPGTGSSGSISVPVTSSTTPAAPTADDGSSSSSFLDSLLGNFSPFPTWAWIAIAGGAYFVFFSDGSSSRKRR